MNSLVLFLACLALLAGTAGCFYVQFTRKPFRRAAVISAILVSLGLIIAGTSAAFPAGLG